MTTNKPPDLAAIRALCGKLEDGPWDANVTVTINRLAASVPALLDEIDRLVDGIRSIIDNDRSDYSWITMELEALLG